MTGAEAAAAIDVRHLHKTYGATVAVDDVSFTVAEGEIFGLLGPNGAGKTTTVECVVGLRRADDGQMRILGLDPVRDREQLRLSVGVQLQPGALPGKLKVGELLDLYRSFYRDPADAEELAKALGLEGKRDAYYQSLSGGQKQRLSIALALIGQPRAAVLDEMTTGLDPHARRDTWDLIEQQRARGVTILLVTHNMEEAARLCDQVALIDQGRIVAEGTPGELARRPGAQKQVRFTPSAPFDDALLTRLPEVSAVEHHGQRVLATGTGDLASAVIGALTADGLTAHDLELASGTLEDAFVTLTGTSLAPQALPPRSPRAKAQPAIRERRPLLPRQVPRRAFAKLIQAEARLAWRKPIGLGIGLVIPVLLLALFGSIPSFQQAQKSLDGLSVPQFYLPTLIVLAFFGIAFFSLPVALAGYREQGILRRLSTTPVPPAWVLGAQLAINVCIAVAGLVVLLVAGTAGIGLSGPRNSGGFVLAVVLAGLAALGIGLCIAGTSRSYAAGAGFGALSYYAGMFFAGLYLPRSELPAVLIRIGDWTPTGAAVDAINQAMQVGFPSASHLLVLTGYALVSGALAIRFFRWE